MTQFKAPSKNTMHAASKNKALKTYECIGTFLPWLVLAAGLFCTYWLYLLMLDDAHNDLLREFELRAEQLIGDMEQRVEMQMLVLRGTSGFLSREKHVTREEFRSYVNSTHINKLTPGVLAIGFTLAIPKQNRVKHVAEWRKKLGADYTVWPSSQQEIISSIVYREQFPFTRSKIMIGFDMYAAPIRRTAMNLARDLHAPVVTSKVNVLLGKNEDSRPGFIMYFPVYRAGADVDTLSNRRQHLVGWSYSPFLADAFVDNLLNIYGEGMQMSLYIGHEPSPTSLLTSNPVLLHAAGDVGTLTFNKTLNMAGQRWHVNVRTLPSFKARLDTSKAILTLIAGGVISILLFLYSWALTRAHAREQKVALRMTNDLRESEQRWQFAIEGQGDGLWDWSLRENTVFYSHRWKEMLGYADDEIGIELEEWRCRIHSEDERHVIEDLDSFVHGNSSQFSIEHRLHCKNGNWKWVQCRGTVVNRASDGYPLRVIGTLSDISERKSTEIQVTRLTQLYSALTHTSQAIVRCKNESELFKEACHIAVQYGGMSMALIGLIDEQEGLIKPVASSGMSEEYFQTFGIAINPDEDADNNNFLRTISRQESVWIDDVFAHASLAHLHPRARQANWSGLASLPICKLGKVIGVYIIYTKESGAFDKDVRDLLIDIATGIGSALDNLAHEFDRTRAEEGLLSSHARMTRLSAELIEAQENERKNLARELHDELGQQLTTLRLDLHYLNALLRDDQAKEAWRTVSDGVGIMTESVRSMSGSLRPPTLDHIGLEASIRQLLHTNFSQSGTEYVFEYAGLPVRLPAQTEITVYRIVQEAVTNIVRHAAASRVIVEMNGGENASEIELVIRDNGRGFDTTFPSASAKHRITYGLTGMRERVNLMNGTIVVVTEVGKGTRITATLPLQS